MVNDTCICGHGRDTHEYAMAPRCAILINRRHLLLAERCGCLEFKQDNLKYLEKLVDEKESGV